MSRAIPYINMMGGELLTTYTGAPELVGDLQQNKATPLALAAADFDEDGVPDLVAGYAEGGRGIITLHRGNIATLYPTGTEAQAPATKDALTEAPFLSPALVYGVPEAAELLAAGDFNADGHWDTVTTRRGATVLLLLRGDGQGGLSAPEEIALDGPVMALVAGEVNQPDGLTDVVVAVDADAGPQLLVFEGPAGALRARPEVLTLPSAAHALVLGQLDADSAMDLIVAAGNELLAVYGRDRGLTLSERRRALVPAARVVVRPFPRAIKSLALGDFSDTHEPNLAVLTDDGVVHLLSPRVMREQAAPTAQPLSAWQERLMPTETSGAMQLMRAKVSSFPGDDLLLLDADRQQVRIVGGDKMTGDKEGARPADDAARPASVARAEQKSGVETLASAAAPSAALPMRLDADALDDLVILQAGDTAPAVALTQQRSGQPIQLTGPNVPLVYATPGDGKLMAAAHDPIKGLNMSPPTVKGPSGLPRGGVTPQYGDCPTHFISYGQTVPDALTTGDCQFLEGGYFDSYSFNGLAGQQVAIALNSPSFDTFLYLLGPDDTAIAIDDDGNGGTNSRIPAGTGFFQLPYNGTYTILVTSFAPAVTGPYVLSLVVNANTCVPTPLIIGQAYNGTLSVTDCRFINAAFGDIYTFNALAGQQIAIGMTSPSFDPLVYLYAPNNTLLAVGDDASFFDSRIPGGGGYLTLPASGTYTIIASSFAGLVEGSYQLAVVNNPNGCGYTPITYGQTLTASLSNTDCVSNSTHYADAYTFFGIAGQPIVVSMASSSFDSYLYLYSPDGLIAFDNDSGGNLNARIPPSPFFFALPMTGFYTIVATSVGNFNIGSYALALNVDIGSTVVTNTSDSGSGSLRNAILIANANPGPDTITFSIGSGVKTITPLSPLPSLTGPVYINGASQPGYVGAPLIEINGAFAGPQTVGLKILGGNSRIRGLVLNRFSIVNIALTGGGGNIVDGNYIGTDQTGLLPQNGTPSGALDPSGIIIDSSSNNLIGGTTTAARNVISGNRGVGISLVRSMRTVPVNNQVQGNYIGLSANGGAAFGNGANGVIFLTGSNNVIGGTAAGARNVISGNASTGVGLGGDTFTAGNLVQGNYVGTNAAGTAALGQQGSGIIVGGFLQLNNELIIATRNTIGGTSPAARNVVSGNLVHGVELINTGTTENKVQGNYIGTDATGTTAIRNVGSGVLVTFAANNTVGGSDSSAGNIISGNGDFGVGVGLPRENPITHQPIIGGKGIDVIGNYIGTNTGGVARLGNGRDGVLIAADAVDNVIAQNVIAFNLRNGIFIPRTTPGSPSTNPGVRNRLDANLIYSNASLGIDLQDPGITPNDVLDVDGGANLQQNFPLDTAGQFSLSAGRKPDPGAGPLAAGTINDTFRSAASTTYTLQFFFAAACQNAQATVQPSLLGVKPVVTDAQGNAPYMFNFTFPGNATAGFVTGTATDPIGDTSEFSPCRPVNAGPATINIGGRISTATGAAIPGVAIALTGAQTATTTCDALGNYSFAGLSAGGTYTMTPSLLAYGFTPLSQTFANVSANQTVNFTGALSTGVTLQLAQAAYTFSEGAPGGATLTVTRTGNLSGTVAVAYATVDDPAAVPCDPSLRQPDGSPYPQGKAYARCDYATAVGTLTFPAGVTSKAINVSLIDDGFVEGAETFQVALSAPVGATLGTATSTVTLTDNDTASAANPILQSPFFVRLQYLDFLSREPDTGGYNAWLNVLNNCSDANNNPTCDRILVSQSFFGSQEFQLKGFYVFRFYRLAFNRLPQYAEIIPDMSFVAGSTPEEVYARKAQLVNAFVQRSEFVTAYGGLPLMQYVNTLLGRYQLTQVTGPNPVAPDGANKVTLTATDLINQLNNGTLTRAQVLRLIADSDEVGSAEFSSAFVAMQYYGYLRRTPEPPGYNSWLTYLNAHPTDYRTMVNGFMNATEYKLRFGKP